MWDFSEETRPIARKDYHCDASDWLSNFDRDEFDKEELAIIDLAKAENNKILITTLEVFPNLNDICVAHDAYDE